MIIDRIKGHLAVEYEKRIIVLDDDFGDLANYVRAHMKERLPKQTE